MLPLSVTSVRPLTSAGWVGTWHLDLTAAVLAALLTGGYVSLTRALHARGSRWPAARTAWFLLAGVGSLLLSTMSFLGAYSRVLFWPAAVENVLLLSLVPVALTAGRPIELARRVLDGRWRPAHRVAVSLRFVANPLVGSVLAVGQLLLLYTTGYDEACLRHPVLLGLLHVQLLATGCLFTWPLLGVDHWQAGMSYPLRSAVAFADGLLDALPGLAVLGTHQLLAGDYYRQVGRAWGPSLQADQRIAGTAIVALSELVALPSLVVLLVRWARDDAAQAEVVDRGLDERATERAAGLTDPLDRSAAALERPWWETDPGPLGERARRQGWDRPAS
ncbi:MAG: cytochrome c oxidase assembly protein [Actinomycetota bacterium]|nr:cytochrome c oxidase assembly protein [Actinomycetota bacterium]